MRLSIRLVLARVLSVGGITLAVACGGSNKDAVTAHGGSELSAAQIDADAIALLPGSAVAIASVDAKAFFASPSLGPTVAKLIEQYFPIGEEAGFKPSRDVDSIVAATYSLQGVDVAAVLKGRFDAKKIADAADKHTPMKSGGALVSSSYSGHTIYTLSNIGFTVMTEHTVIAGTEAGIHRALDRVHDGKKARDLTVWMVETIETKGAAFGLAADFATQPITSVALGNLPPQYVKGIKAIRLVGDFKDTGVQIAGSITYDTEDNANNGLSNAKQVTSLANLAAITGLVPRLENLDLHTEKTSLQYKFSVDDSAVSNLLQNLPQLIKGQ